MVGRWWEDGILTFILICDADEVGLNGAGTLWVRNGRKFNFRARGRRERERDTVLEGENPPSYSSQRDFRQLTELGHLAKSSRPARRGSKR